MAKVNTVEKVKEASEPVIESLGYELVDVEFVKEAGNWYLRFYIDKEGGVTIDDCEAASRKLDSVLDEIDPIEQSYILEVSSPGTERPLKKDKDFEKFKGKDVEVRLYKPSNGKKVFEGKLVGLLSNNIVINIEDENLSFNREDVSLVKLVDKF